jgi:hypothetical protein
MQIIGAKGDFEAREVTNVLDKQLFLLGLQLSFVNKPRVAHGIALADSSN